jgi:hypothetical protein
VHKSTYSKSHIDEFARVLLHTGDNKKVKNNLYNCVLTDYGPARPETFKCDELKTVLFWLWRFVFILYIYALLIDQINLSSTCTVEQVTKSTRVFYSAHKCSKVHFTITSAPKFHSMFTDTLTERSPKNRVFKTISAFA